MAKDMTDRLADTLKRAADNTRDAVHEVQHRATADAERDTREELGDEMTTSEKVGSAFNEAKNRTQAEIDEAKLKARNGK